MSEIIIIERLLDLATEIIGGIAAGVGYFLTCNYYKIYIKKKGR